MAQNRALLKNSFEYRLLKGNCVFISHKKEDEEAAIVIANYIMEKAGIDVYLDLYDVDLREAVSVGNDRKIVESIKQGLTTSTHLLCVVSDRTKLSWWVPYEIGIASMQKKNIATLKLKTTTDIPSFLKTEQVIRTIEEFFEYSCSLDPIESILHTRRLEQDDKTRLYRFVSF